MTSEAPELLPCPHCGEKLVLKDDHHGDWWGHRNDATGSCIHSVTQLMDAEDFAAWNRRSALATPLAPAAPRLRERRERPPLIWTCPDCGKIASRCECAPAAPEADGWRTMDSAPKDRLIDLWLAGEVRWCDCYYDQICDEWRTSRPGGNLIRVKAAAVMFWREPPASPAVASASQADTDGEPHD